MSLGHIVGLCENAKGSDYESGPAGDASLVDEDVSVDLDLEVCAIVGLQRQDFSDSLVGSCSALEMTWIMGSVPETRPTIQLAMARPKIPAASVSVRTTMAMIRDRSVTEANIAVPATNTPTLKLLLSSRHIWSPLF